MDAIATVSILGAEGTGKSTLCDGLAAELGGLLVITPEWPSFRHFLNDPKTYAFQNQIEAMNRCLRAYGDARYTKPGSPILIDLCPDRIHLVYSWVMKQLGFLSAHQWDVLQAQYDCACEGWPRNYIYLRASETILRLRLAGRGRVEDCLWNGAHLSMSITRWEDLVSSNWRHGKVLLELSSELPVEEMINAAAQWCRITLGLG